MPSAGESPLRLMLVCGEPSGDLLGAQLMAGLQTLALDRVTFSGIGGPAMEAEGLKSLFSIDATSVMGLYKIARQIPEIFQRIRAASNYANATQPDALVCIDSPEFTHRIARRVRRLSPGIRTVSYVAPQVWASRAYRAKNMSRYFDLVLALLPFEVPFFESHGVNAQFVGHPVVERAASVFGGDALRKQLGIAPSDKILLTLPGSRISEVRPLLPVFRATLALVRESVRDVVCVLPTLPHVAGAVHELTSDWPVPLHIVQDEAGKFAALAAADAALVASGTATSELAIAGVPMAVAYKVGWLTSHIARAMIRVPHVTLVNLLLGREAVPEFLQERCRPDLLAPCLVRLLLDTETRERQTADLHEAMRLLGVDEEKPSLRAARALLEFLDARQNLPQRSSIGI